MKSRTARRRGRPRGREGGGVLRAGEAVQLEPHPDASVAEHGHGLGGGFKAISEKR